MTTKSTVTATNCPQRKLALVIGIGIYGDDTQNLDNAVNDANAMSSALEYIGFHIEGDKPKINLTKKDMDHALVDFEHSVREGDMVVFYFAGHGKQWEVCKLNLNF
jgi:uncharacterized caspase-like protein